MKGIILAGGKGTRLAPFTKIINKHLLPVGPQPMIFWSIQKLREAGMTELLIVTNRKDYDDFYQILGKGDALGVHITYAFQREAGGIAEAVYLGKDFVNQERCVVLLGDNIFKEPLTQMIKTFKQQEAGAMVLLKEVSDPRRYGVAEVDEAQRRIKKIVEKPQRPLSRYCVTGAYLYDHQVFDLIEEVIPSSRGELEITDVNNLYIAKNELTYQLLHEWWIDAGTHDALFRANCLVYEEKVKASCEKMNEHIEGN
ncbi:glucose-1-phosphate thymidylyltransferase [Pullulanibacillus camelliae]|uniref:Glucose-1-phosphate thymidylyltransferase n=1 Tax=Pullulanibacillus camelliae TaxID=1707096 RepID=A0A8J2VUX0_9BACL|nr:sugar phosphate nucleotidyltransferase [Pullulanibacillus camelliae]GGE39272.1 glucose-1-phosphate thymidylyltransferase [Pullulanibacillus camelliae]